MKGARKVAFAAAIGNLLQGWDNADIAGGLLYITPRFHLEEKPNIVGLVVSAALMGSVLSTIFAGPGADWLGRRIIFCISAVIYVISTFVMTVAPGLVMLIIGRILVGVALGLIVAVVPIYIAEVAPPEIRGQLATLPQLIGTSGLLLAYVLVFLLSLTQNPSWRIMLGNELIPGLLYLSVALFYLPESPRWLVSKGRMREAKQVLQYLRDKDDVTAELALLVEGLGVGGLNTTFEEWLLQPAEVGEEPAPVCDEHQIKWIATPITDENALLSRCSSIAEVNAFPIIEPFIDPLVDPVVTLLANLQHAQEQHALEHPIGSCEHLDPWDEENKGNHDGFHDEGGVVGDFDEHVVTPMLSRHASSKLELLPHVLKTDLNTPLLSRNNSSKMDMPSLPRGESRLAHVSTVIPHGSYGTYGSSVDIGSGWQLAWQWVPPETGHEEGEFRRVFLLQEGTEPTQSASQLSLPGVGVPPDQETIQAAALVGQPAQLIKDIIAEEPVGPAMVHPAETAVQGPVWSDLLEGGVKHALIVGLGLQILQQLNGITPVLYFVPQILQQSGAQVLLSKAGISGPSASILASGVMSCFMVPCIVLAMRLMDIQGRRHLLLATIPVLFFALLAVILASVLLPVGIAQAAGSFAGVTFYTCSFVMGFGPIPNILCSEIFPTRVRGLCSSLCQFAFWSSNIVVTYLFPVLLANMGVGGVFGLLAGVSIVSWIFVFLKVPETKGLPLEVICEFFAMSARDTKKMDTESSPYLQ